MVYALMAETEIAQWTERMTPGLVVVGSIPALALYWLGRW